MVRIGTIIFCNSIRYYVLITIIKIHINDYLFSIMNTCKIHLTVHLDVTLKWSFK
jgi:hypothetical protein